jgi:hypothetical protein
VAALKRLAKAVADQLAGGRLVLVEKVLESRLSQPMARFVAA